MTISSQVVRNVFEGDGSTVTFWATFPVLDEDGVYVVYRDVNDVESILVRGVGYTVALTDGGSTGCAVTLSSIVPLADEFISLVCRPPITQLLNLSNVGSLPLQSLEDQLDKTLNTLKYLVLDQITNRVIRLPDGAATAEDHSFDAYSTRISNVLDPTADQDAATKAYVAAEILAAEITPGTISNLSVFSALRLADETAAAWLTGLGVSAYWQAVLDETALAASLSAMGFSSVVQNILLDATAAAILTELGLSAFMQTVVDDTTSLAARATLEIGKDIYRVNELLNGDFQVWQHGIAFDSVTPAAGGNDDGEYFADQWILLSDGNDVVDIDRIVVGVGPEARGLARFTVVDSTKKFGFLQILDQRTTKFLRNQPMSFSIRMQGDNDLRSFKMLVLAWSGTPDAPTIDPIATWEAATVLPTLAAGWAISPGGEYDFETSGSGHSTFTLENITMNAPGGMENLGFLIVSNDGGYSNGDVVDATCAQAVRGEFATPFRPRHFSEEFALCERFFCKTFDDETFPVAAVGLNTGCIEAFGQDEGGNQGCGTAYWQFPTRMLKAPTIATYNPVTAANVNWRRTNRAYGAGADIAIVTGTPTTRGMAFGSDASPALADAILQIHATADARF